MYEGALCAVKAGEEVVPAAEVKALRARIRELERVLGRKTMEVEILKEAIANKGSSVDDYRDIEGRKGQHQFYLRAYGREGEPCYHCGTTIRRIVINSRSSHFNSPTYTHTDGH